MVEAEYRLILGIPLLLLLLLGGVFLRFCSSQTVRSRETADGKTLYNHIPRRNNIVVPTPAACKRAS